MVCITFKNVKLGQTTTIPLIDYHYMVVMSEAFKSLSFVGLFAPSGQVIKKTTLLSRTEALSVLTWLEGDVLKLLYRSVTNSGH